MLNLGHTFGHALEAESGYGEVLTHGEAVSIGMVMAFDLSVRLGLCPASDLERLRRALSSFDMPVDLPALPKGKWDADKLFGHFANDKKVKDGRVTFVLARGIGQSFLSRDVPQDATLAVLADAVARAQNSGTGPT